MKYMGEVKLCCPRCSHYVLTGGDLCRGSVITLVDWRTA